MVAALDKQALHLFYDTTKSPLDKIPSGKELI
jgi:hypothetical protein